MALPNLINVIYRIKCSWLEAGFTDVPDVHTHTCLQRTCLESGFTDVPDVHTHTCLQRSCLEAWFTDVPDVHKEN
jgi:hypothetical protein